MNTIRIFLTTTFVCALLFAISASGYSKRQDRSTNQSGESQTAAVERLQKATGGKIEITWNQEHTAPSFLSGELSSFHGDLKSESIRFLNNYRTIFSLENPDTELILSRSETDDLGMTHLRYQQVWRTIPVLDHILILHISKSGVLTSISSGVVPSPNIEISPSISESTAKQTAAADVIRRHPALSTVCAAKLCVDYYSGKPVLTWEVTVTSPNNLAIGDQIYIDAIKGTITRRGTMIRSESVPKDKSFTKGVTPPFSSPDELNTILISEGFEGTYPATGWSISDSGGVANHNAYDWGDNSYKSYGGNWSCFCADSNDNTAHTYPNSYHKVLQTSTFNLTGYTWAHLRFFRWMNTESGYDSLTVYCRNQAGTWNRLHNSSGSYPAWQLIDIDLGSYLNQSNLAIRFIFDADNSIVPTGDAGVWIDSVVVEATTTGGGPRVGSGTGVLGQTRSLNTYLTGTQYRLVDATRYMYRAPVDSMRGVIATYDARHDSDYTRAIITVDPNNDNNWNDNTELRSNVDAHYYSGSAYEFYRTAFNRNSYNNNGASLKSIVHYRTAYNNAFWTDYYHLLVYGDGDGNRYRSFVAGYDVIIHELSHGVTFSTSNLNYHLQSGAINESMSDVMACVADSGNWTIAENVVLVSPYFMRSFQNPHVGTNWQPAIMSEFVTLPDSESGDWGGVHINSGIPNHAFYYAASALNRLQAGQIWYRANTVYLTPTSNFISLRAACIQAAADLFGAGAVSAVTNAFNLVGVGGSTTRMQFVSTNVPLAIPDLGVAVAIVNVPSWPNAANIAVSLSITHSYDGDLKICLVNPAGDTVVLSNRNGGSGDNYTNTTFIDSASTRIATGSAPFTGYFRPDSILSRFESANGNLAHGRWALVVRDMAGGDSGRITAFTLSFDYSTEVKPVQTLQPSQIALYNAYPNPFNPVTDIRFSLPKYQRVTLRVYNSLGREVCTLVNGLLAAGEHTLQFDGSRLASGVYYYQLSSGSFVAAKKMVLLK